MRGAYGGERCQGGPLTRDARANLGDYFADSTLAERELSKTVTSYDVHDRPPVFLKSSHTDRCKSLCRDVALGFFTAPQPI